MSCSGELGGARVRSLTSVCGEGAGGARCASPGLLSRGGELGVPPAWLRGCEPGGPRGCASSCGGELGGPRCAKIVSAVFCFGLWIVYVLGSVANTKGWV